MKFWIRQVVFGTLACLVIPLVSGCGNTTNEVASAGTKGTPPPDAPKSQQDFYGKQKSQAKVGKPATQSTR